MPISPDVHIMSQRELDERLQKAFQRGVERGRFEERMVQGKEMIALNCANWKNGRCERCGVEHQYFEVSSDYKCPHFTYSEDQEGK
jgi:hypothetical protein